MSYRIYTAGKMAGLSKRDQIGWRYKIEQCVRDAADMFGIPQSSLKFIHPPVYYTYGEKHYQSEKEIKDWDINQVCKSDIVIVNLDSVDDSIGTHYELATVDAVNSFNNKHIFAVFTNSS